MATKSERLPTNRRSCLIDTLLNHGKAILWLIPALFCSACVTLPDQAPPEAMVLKNAIYLDPDLKNQQNISTLLATNVFYLTPNQKSWLDNQFDSDMTKAMKFNKLTKLFSPKGLRPLSYDSTSTQPANLVMETGRGNCLSMTALFYAAAKHIGLDVSLNKVSVPPTWDRFENSRTFVLYEHVNALVRVPLQSPKYVDFSAELFDLTFDSEIIDENEYQALYFNNKAMELLENGELETAHRLAIKAVSMVPDSANLWNNLGVIHRWLGNQDESKASFEQSIFLDNQNYMAWTNLASSYRIEGDVSTAKALESALDNYKKKNPYYLNLLAKRSIETGDLEKSLDLIKQAIRLKPQEHRFHRQSAVIYFLQERYDLASISMEAAKRLATNPRHKRIYKAKLEAIIQASIKEKNNFADLTTIEVSYSQTKDGLIEHDRWSTSL